MPAATGSEAISPTAHYTGYVWARNGLSHPALKTLEGRLMYEGLRPVFGLGASLLGVSMERYLLARHRAIDSLLTTAIESGAVSQVVELACGMSPRGWRFSNRYGTALRYVETDLPGMAARKRRALEGIGSISDVHRVEELDALRDDGPASLSALAGTLDPERGTAVITEGLLSYLDFETVVGLWSRIARELQRFPEGRYLSELHLAHLNAPYIRAFRAALQRFVRGGVHFHLDSDAQAEEQLRRCGFAAASVRPGTDFDPGSGGGGRLVHIIEASTVKSQ
jgi:O-methyltransferase involved in polyketide biosynthesis